MVALQNNHVQSLMMTQIEARQAFNKVKTNIEECRHILLDLNRRQGWKALNYKSWDEAVKTEFGTSRSQAYRQLAAAVVDDALGEQAPQYSITTNEGEQLKRLAPPDSQLDADLVKQALDRAEEIAKNRGQAKRTVHNVQQAVEEIILPDWSKSASFAVEVEGKAIAVRCEINYAEGKQVRFLYKGEPDTISANGEKEEELSGREHGIAIKKYASPREYATHRLQGLYGMWQVAINLKATLTKDYPTGSYIRITKEIPGYPGEVNRVCAVVGGHYDGLCVNHPDWDTAIILPPGGYFEAVEVGDKGIPITRLEDVKSVADMDALIDFMGGKGVAEAYINATPEVRKNAVYYYPGMSSLITAELGAAAWNKTTTEPEKKINEPDAVVREQLEAENGHLNRELTITEQQLQQREKELTSLKIEQQTTLQFLERRIAELEQKLAENDEIIASYQQPSQTAEPFIEDVPSINYNDLIDPTIAKLGYSHQGHVAMARKAIKAFIELLQP